jgi:diguanylate cyclase (GGDEF)-like protein
MNLKTLFWLAALTYTLVIGGSLLLYRLYVVFPAIEDATLNARIQSVQSISSLYMAERKSLMGLNRHWAWWSETYQFVENKNADFINHHIKGHTFEAFNIDAFAIIDLKGNTLYATQKQNNFAVGLNQIQQISDDLDIKHLINTNEQSGIIRIKGQYGLYASHHIQDSSQTNASNGVLIFIRIFKPEFFKRIKLVSNANINMASINTTIPYPDIYNAQATSIQDHYNFSLMNKRGNVIGQTQIHFPVGSTPKLLDTLTLVSILILLTLPLFLSGLSNYLILKPGIEISNEIYRMKSSGNAKYLTQKSNIKEVDRFLKTFNTLVDKINMYQQKLVNDSNTDGLTGIFNRKYFDLEYDKSWRISTRSGGPLSIIMMDIDFFKKYNDHYGHQQGDTALKQVAIALSHVTRRADDTLARYGGEEFVLISHAKNKQQLENILRIILTSIEELNIEHVESLVADTLTISCGACFIENNGPAMKDLKLQALKAADEALYLAKESGRNQFSIRTFDVPKNAS